MLLLPLLLLLLLLLLLPGLVMYPASRSTAFPSSSSSRSQTRLWLIYQRLSLRLLYFSARCWLLFLISLALLLLVANLAFAYLPASPLPAGIGLLQKLADPFKRGQSAAAGPINAAPPVATRSSGAAAAAAPSHAAAASQLLQPLALNASSSPLWTAVASSYCDRQFGNGFSVSVQLCSASPSASALRCLHNPLTASTLCEARNVALDAGRVEVSRGDEEIEAVRGRAEEAEFPKYSPGRSDARLPAPVPASRRRSARLPPPPVAAAELRRLCRAAGRLRAAGLGAAHHALRVR